MIIKFYQKFDIFLEFRKYSYICFEVEQFYMLIYIIFFFFEDSLQLRNEVLLINFLCVCIIKVFSYFGI